MIVQHYRVPIDIDTLIDARPGQFVFKNNDSDIVEGFVYKVTLSYMEMVLFTPAEVEVKGMVVISDDLGESWAELLKEAIDNGEEGIREQWKELIQKYI